MLDAAQTSLLMRMQRAAWFRMTTRSQSSRSSSSVSDAQHGASDVHAASLAPPEPAALVDAIAPAPAADGSIVRIGADACIGFSEEEPPAPAVCAGAEALAATVRIIGEGAAPEGVLAVALGLAGMAFAPSAGLDATALAFVSTGTLCASDCWSGDDIWLGTVSGAHAPSAPAVSANIQTSFNLIIASKLLVTPARTTRPS
jgi:hypothetical protein